MKRSRIEKWIEIGQIVSAILISMEMVDIGIIAFNGHNTSYLPHIFQLGLMIFIAMIFMHVGVLSDDMFYELKDKEKKLMEDDDD